jgi:hypothetical protein
MLADRLLYSSAVLQLVIDLTGHVLEACGASHGIVRRQRVTAVSFGGVHVEKQDGPD